jgi:hypothetical protein
MAPCFFGGLCFLTFCGGLDGRVLVCCSVFGTLLLTGVLFMLLSSNFLLRCWCGVPRCVVRNERVENMAEQLSAFQSLALFSSCYNRDQ